MAEIHCEFDGVPFGSFQVKDERAFKGTSASLTVELIRHDAMKRTAVSSFISTIYQETYQAKIRVDYPYLICLVDQKTGVLAAAGFRPAEEAPLFLEQYLNDPIERIMDISRNEIVEIGNLAGATNGAATLLFAAMASYFFEQGFTTAVATGSPFLERRFKQLGLQPQKLARASSDALKISTENWGSYYNSNPSVMYGSILLGYQRLHRLLGVEYRYGGTDMPQISQQKKVTYHVV